MAQAQALVRRDVAFDDAGKPARNGQVPDRTVDLTHAAPFTPATFFTPRPPVHKR